MTRPLIHLAEIALGRQRSPEHERGDHMVPYLRSANVIDGSLDLSDVKLMNFSPREQSIFALDAGDVMVTEGSGSRDTVGTSAVWRDDLPGPVCFQNTLLRLRPRPGVSDGRYLAWWARHAHASGLMAATATGANILHLSAEALHRLPIPDLELDLQRRIADFLDDQVARIDDIIAARRRQASLIAETRDVSLDSLFNGPRRPLRTILAQSPRYGVLVPRFVETNGVPFVRVNDLESLSDSGRALVRIEPAQSVEYRRTLVTSGDVLVSVVGSLDKSAIVSADRAGSNIARAVARLRPASGIPSEVIWGWLKTTEYRDQAKLATGSDTAQPTLNMGDLSGFRVSLPTGSSTQLAAKINAVLDRHYDWSGVARASIDRFDELKRALITAAVTGEFDVSSADGSRVPA